MILTNNKKIALNVNGTTFVKDTNIHRYNGNREVIAVVCSRALASKLLSIDLPNLKLVQLTSAGFEGINIEAYKNKGISISNAADIYSVGMAEFVVYSMLQSAKRYNVSPKNHRIRIMRNYKYITELAEKNVVILGVGSIGGEVAKRLSAFDMNIVGFAHHTKQKVFFNSIVNSMVELKPLLYTADYIISTLPDTKETENLIDADFLSNLNSHVTIVNVGRRKVLNERDLYRFLKETKGATAILDMFEKLPNPLTNPFHRLHNVIVLPGVTAVSQEIDKKLCLLVQRNLEALYNDGKIENIIDNG